MRENKVLKNASWIIVCRIGQAVLSLIITMFTARYLGTSSYGLINYVAAIVIFVTPIVQMGLSGIQVQEFINHPKQEGKIIGTTLGLSFLSAVVCYIFIICFVLTCNRGETDTLIVSVLYSLQLFFQGSELLQYWFQAKYMSKYASIITLIAFAIVSFYKIIILIVGKSIYWFALSNVIDFFIIETLLLMVYKKMGGMKLELSIEVAKRMLSRSKHYIVSNMMIVIFTQTDRIMLKNMMGDSATGIYTAATTCACMANFVFLAIIDSARPAILTEYNDNRIEYEKKVSLLYSVIIYCSIFLNIGIVLFANSIIKIIYGENYLSAVTPLKIAVWYTTFSFIGSVRNIWILAESKQKWMWIINLSGAATNIILNLLLIKVWGECGAAVASLFSQIMANIVVCYLISDTRANTYLMINGLNPKIIITYIKKILMQNHEKNK